MNLPFDPHVDLAILISPIVDEEPKLSDDSVQRDCHQCGIKLWVTPETLTFSEQHELPIMCTPCGKAFITKDQ